MAAIDSYAGGWRRHGSLIGISTIHFVRWLLLDDGRRLMMVSDYDGSWESLHRRVRRDDPLRARRDLGDARSAIPPDGARDLPAFKRFLRSHQVPSEVFYSAYPDETVLNIVNDRAFARACADAAAGPRRHSHAVVSLTDAASSRRLADDVRADIQGFITSGYGHLSHAAYLFLAVSRRRRRAATGCGASCRPSRPPRRGRSRRTARRSSRRSALNIAFTAAGLAALGLPRQVLCTFPVEFQEGIAASEPVENPRRHRRERPRRMGIGGPRTAAHPRRAHHSRGVDDRARAPRAARSARCSTTRQAASSSCPAACRADTGRGRPRAVRVSRRHRAAVDCRHHRRRRAHRRVHPRLPEPLRDRPADAGRAARSWTSSAVLPPLANPYHASRPLRDLGLNGSYVVYRKLQQDVAGFWQFMKREAVRSTGAEDTGCMIWLASRCVGRWPSGAPLVLAPDADDPQAGDRDDFSTATIRMVSPARSARTSAAPIRATIIKPYAAAQSLSMSEAHRLLRRARAFGPPLFDPAVLTESREAWPAAQCRARASPTTAAARHSFLLRQRQHQAPVRVRAADLVQQPAFRRASTTTRIRSSVTTPGPDQPSSHMTIPHRPVRVRTAALPRFVKVRAGAYLFMPSLAALRFLGRLSRELKDQR